MYTKGMIYFKSSEPSECMMRFLEHKFRGMTEKPERFHLGAFVPSMKSICTNNKLNAQN